MLDLPAYELRPLRRVEYEELSRLGHFDDERVELLYGAIVRMSPTHPPHSGILQRLTQMLARALDESQAGVRIQSPLALSSQSMPEPDLAIVPPGDYLEAHPTEAWLIIEVAESSLKKDRVIKARLYAEAAVPEYWIVDVEANLIEVRTGPEGGNYARVAVHGRGTRISLVRFPEVSLSTDRILR
ncbi:MAG: Uma2 family endonuclease [Polyangiaceae bacterium]